MKKIKLSSLCLAMSYLLISSSLLADSKTSTNPYNTPNTQTKSAPQAYNSQGAKDDSASQMPQEPSLNTQVTTEVEKYKKSAEEDAKRSLVQDAVSVIEEVKKALNFLRQGNGGEARGALDKASSKLSSLLSRNPGKSLLPIDYSVVVVNSAPIRLDAIKEVASEAEDFVKDKRYPEARVLLNALRSEITVDVLALPVGAYQDILKKASDLIDQGKLNEASAVLFLGLNSTVIIDQTLPIPLIRLDIALKIAEDKAKQNKDLASNLLKYARFELERAKALGYIHKNDEEYSVINDAIKDVESQVSSNQSNESIFRSLKDKYKAFLKKHFDKKKESKGELPQSDKSTDSKQPKAFGSTGPSGY